MVETLQRPVRPKLLRPPRLALQRRQTRQGLAAPPATERSGSGYFHFARSYLARTTRALFRGVSPTGRTT